MPRMAEHSDLVCEINSVERMSTLDRLKHAKKRRTQQLKKFVHYEKQLEKDTQKRRKAGASAAVGKKARKTRNVHFISDVMLLESAARNDLDEVRKLLKEGVSPDAMNEDGLTALHQCCIDDLEAMMHLLLEFGANVNACDSELWTPLHAAATCGHVHLCKYLIDHHAEILAVNADGNMPYDICEDELTLDFIESEMSQRGVTQEMIDETRLSTETRMLTDMKYLSEKGESLMYRGRNGETPLHIAAANGYVHVAEYLLNQHVAADAVDDDLWQPIHASACWGQLPVLELLVENGADLEAVTKGGETPLDICEDLELKQRIMEMKDEIESHRATRKRDLVRKRSQNTRSASIRRTSMREKSQMHFKEAKEEAMRLRESADNISPDDEEDDDDKITATNGIEQIDSNKTQVDSSKTTVEPPPTSADDVKINLTRDSLLVPSVAPPRPGGKNKDVANHRKKGTDSPVTNRKAPAKDVAVAAKPVAKPDAKPVAKPDTTSTGKDKTKEKMPSLDLPIAKLSGSPSSVRGNESTRGNESDQKRAESNHTVSPTHSSSNIKQPSSSSLSSVGAPRGSTLADLKRVRAQKLQDSLRFRDTKLLNEQINNHNSLPVEGSTVSNGDEKSNGHNGSLRNSINSNLSGETTTEPQKHRFTARATEIVGDDNRNDNSCCTIL